MSFVFLPSYSLGISDPVNLSYYECAQTGVFTSPSTMMPQPCLLKIYQLWHLSCFYCDIDYIIQIHETHSEYQGSAEILPGEGKISCHRGTL